MDRLPSKVSHASSLMRLNFRLVAKVTCALPLFSFVFCVIIALLIHFKSSTATHCKVANYLPSISAAIGGLTPERYIWRAGIALHTAPRYMVTLMYYNFYRSRSAAPAVWYQLLYKLTCLLNIVEVSSLVVLTYVSSTENPDIHEVSFISFVVCSEVYMFFTCVLLNWSAYKPISEQEQQSLRWKTVMFVANVSSFLTSVYFYFRHNWYCEPGVYTMFALCEYIVVVTNIAFHYTAVLDFPTFSVTVGSATVSKNS
ncbi:post-GPI attachment to proteins factor 2-like isoform X1 [Branchiostoma floridae]|uniref:Acyltransferase PGAP2 n=1 Tax=Branchiostoma floridae TaxID=7739 RepID=A0A9J7LJW1_BRAFL|nr:post-GPI attachment to proteins factor 2-like isoform X1 [Branchiostoma floridae]